MKFTLSWLKKFLDTSATLDEMSATLSKIGFEVESISDRSAELEAFEVAEIIEATPHPSADKLKVCVVKAKGGDLQIVCGAPNARAGIKVVLAPIGTPMPRDNFTIKKAKIRDVESNGMLCSADELLIGADTGGIIELDNDAVVGEKIAKFFGLDDPVIEISVTPNRGDCLGVYGIARELAAAGLGKLIPMKWPEQKFAAASIIDDKNDCRAFCALEVHNITNPISPLWLQHLLKNIGNAPISAVVDITNYISISFARPLHAYDADKLSGGLKVNRAKNGEKFNALSGKTYELNEGDLVVRDDAIIQALAGIIGGAESSCSESTKNIIIESANFNEDLIIATGRKYGIETDARFKAERSIDLALTVHGATLAAEMIREICGGEIKSVQLSGDIACSPEPVSINEEDIKGAIGVHISIKEAGAILMRLGFEISYNGTELTAKHPSWRHDISIKEDLIEEIVRIYGFENIPSTPIGSELTFRLCSAGIARANLARRVLASSGYDELITWSFMSSKFAKLFTELKDKLYIQNPISAELDYMRPSILPNLLEAIAKNGARGIKSGALFEVGPAFLGTEYSDEKTHASGVMWGDGDVLMAKADAFEALSECGVSVDALQIKTDNIPPYYHPNRSGAIAIGNNLLAFFGEIHPAVTKEYGIGARVVAFEVNISSIPEQRLKYGKRPEYAPSDYQQVTRDFAFVVDEKTPAGDMIGCIASVDKRLIKDVEIFDIYVGDKIEQGKKSIAFRVTAQANDRTLSDDELKDMHGKIVSAVEGRFSAQLRG